MGFGRVGAFLAPGVLVGGLWWARQPGERELIVDTGIEPYAARLRVEDFVGARLHHTSADYQASVDEVVYLAGQARNRDELGGLRSIELTAEPLQHLTDDDGDAFVRAFVTWKGERGQAEVALDLVPDGEGWRIERTWAWPPDAAGVERVF